MKNLLTLILFSAVLFPAVGQKSQPKFGDVTMEEMQMKVYGPDSSAVAVILFDRGESVFTRTDAYFQKHTRIKILKVGGLNWGDGFIGLEGFVRERIVNFKASTFNLVNGKIEETKLDDVGKFTEEFVEGLEVLKFAMPDVKAGSVIEFSYKLRGSGIQDWQFQDRIPCKSSVYSAFVTKQVALNVFTQGYIRHTSFDKTYEYKGSEECVKYHWVMDTIPAFEDEPFISSYRNYISKVSFDIASVEIPGWRKYDVLTDWGRLRETYRNSQFYEGNFKNSAFLKKVAENVTADCKNQDEKVLSLYYYVKRQIEWNGRNSVIAQDLKKSFDRRLGSSGEINAMLLAMLLYADIDSEPVLISTRDHGFVRSESLSARQFNKMIVRTQLNGKFILLDATDKYLTHEFLPENCLNGIGNGYRVGKSSYEWIPLRDPAKTKTKIMTNLEVHQDGTAKGNVVITKDGYAAREVREQVREKKDQYLKSLFQGNQEFEMLSSSFENVDTLLRETSEKYEFDASNFFQRTRELLYINPILLSTLAENPFKKEKREYPIDFGFSTEVTYTIKIKVHPSYTIDDSPKQSMHVLPNNAGKYIYTVNQTENEVTIITKFTLNQSFFTQEEYPTLRELYNIINGKQSEQVVLRKI